MMDPNDHMSEEITNEEAPAVIALFQQWLADRDLTIAGLRIKLAKANARLQLANEETEKVKDELEVVRGATPTVNAPEFPPLLSNEDEEDNF